MLENIGQIIIAILIIGVALYFFIWFYFNTNKMRKDSLWHNKNNELKKLYDIYDNYAAHDLIKDSFGFNYNPFEEYGDSYWDTNSHAPSAVADLCKEISDLNQKYQLNCRPTAKMLKLTAYLQQVYESGIFNDADAIDNYGLVHQIRKSFTILYNEYLSLYKAAEQQANLVQADRDQKELSQDNINGLSPSAKAYYYSKLGQKVNHEAEKY